MLNVDLFINGLIIGLFYALMAVALTLGFDPWLALPLALAAGALAGWLTERTLMRPLYAGYSSWGLMRDEYAVVVTFALSLLLINLVDKVVGPYPQRGPGLVDIPRMALGPIMVSGQKLVATGMSIAMIAGLVVFLRYSLWGRQIQAVAQNRLGASLAGVDTARASSLVFALSGALAALAGALLAPIINASPDVGAFPAIKSYVIVVLGGMGSMPGSIAASLALGVLESFGAVYISYDYRDTFGLVILMLVLIFRPQGLFGERGREV